MTLPPDRDFTTQVILIFLLPVLLLRSPPSRKNITNSFSRYEWFFNCIFDFIRQVWSKED